ncbi:MAG: PaaX family transcriptional regulator C-terminal domain-containing protein [Actinomycetota bacterium]
MTDTTRRPTAGLDRLDGWADAPDISARSVLVTIFGDSILPVTKTFWLAQLFRLTESLGFNERQIRTSMFRLAAEDWVTSERVGRQSQYTLTPLAVSESEQASRRIYHNDPPDWSGSWTLVMLGGPATDPAARDAIGRHLRWNGFIPLGADLLGSPATDPETVKRLLRLVDQGSGAAVATAAFVDLADLVEDGFFAAAFNTDEIEADYRTFIQRYDGLGEALHRTSPLEAFAVRTMLIHDLRRIRLRSPDVPAELLPDNWIGYRADAIAGDLYRVAAAGSAPALGEILDLTYPTELPERFA